MTTCYYLPYNFHEAKDGITLTARDTLGEIITSGAGTTLEEAQEDLKVFATAVMNAMAEKGIDPISILGHGELPEHALPFAPPSLFPVTLRWIRRSKGLTQAEVAALLGIAQPSYAKYEQSGVNPSLDVVYRIEEALGVAIIPMVYGPPRVA